MMYELLLQRLHQRRVYPIQYSPVDHSQVHQDAHDAIIELRSRLHSASAFGVFLSWGVAFSGVCLGGSMLLGDQVRLGAVVFGSGLGAILGAVLLTASHHRLVRSE